MTGAITIGWARRKLFIGASVAYATLLWGSLTCAYLMEKSSLPACSGDEQSLPWSVAVAGKASLPQATRYRDEESERVAAYARLTAAMASILYLLLVGLLHGPRSLRILSSNLLVLLLALICLEGFMELFGMHYPAVVRRDANSRNLWVYDRTKGWTHFPNGHGAVPITGPDLGLVRINSLGLRGGEVSVQKPDGVKRVLVLGDSFAFGLGVDEENLFTTHLGKFLNERREDDGPVEVEVEVINAGVTGYSTDQQYLLFSELGLKLHPDVVVLIMCDNDFLGNRENFSLRRYYKPFFVIGDSGELELQNTPVPVLSRAQRIKLFFGQEFYLWNFFRSRESPFPWIMNFVHWFQIDSPNYSDMGEIDITEALVLAIAERAEATGARFLVTNTGHNGEMTPLYHELRPRLRRPGLHLLGLEETLGDARRNQPDKLWDFGRDTHWNVDAHRLAGEVIANYILWNGLLEDGDQPFSVASSTRR